VSGLLFVAWRGLKAEPGSRPSALAHSGRSGASAAHKSITRRVQGDGGSTAPRNKFSVARRLMSDE
jgi:hypothetical protein